MKEIDKLIAALECSIRPYSEKDCDCSKCKYEYLERVDDSIPVPADTEKNGVKYWRSCDCDQMVKDAIQTIKALDQLLDWAIECDFGLNSIGDTYEQCKYKLTNDMSYKDMIIKVAECYLDDLRGDTEDGKGGSDTAGQE